MNDQLNEPPNEPPQPLPTKRVRRWRQFGLRALLVVMLAVGLPLGWVAREIRTVRQRVEALRHLTTLGVRFAYQAEPEQGLKFQAIADAIGGEFHVPPTPPEPPAIEPRSFRDRLLVWCGQTIPAPVAVIVVRPGKVFDDEDLKLLRLFPEITRLSISAPRVTDDGMRHLAGLTNLKHLYVHGSQLSGHWLVHLRGLSDLQGLTLDDVQVDDEDLSELPRHLWLRELELTGSERLKGPGLANLGGMSSLEWLGVSLSQAAVASDGTVRIPPVPSLRWLDVSSTNVKRLEVSPAGGSSSARGELADLQLLFLYGTPFNDEGVARLPEMPNLEHLHLADTDVTSASLKHFRRWKKLNQLKLKATKVDDQGLRSLLALPNLQSVDLCETDVTARGLRSLGNSELVSKIQFEDIQRPPGARPDDYR